MVMILKGGAAGGVIVMFSLRNVDQGEPDKRVQFYSGHIGEEFGRNKLLPSGTLFKCIEMEQEGYQRCESRVRELLTEA
jgi:hypothetical protein